MPVYRHVRTLLSVTEASAENQTGSTCTVMPLDGDDVSDQAQGWLAFFDVTQSGGDTSPTTDVTLQTSHDGESWIDVVGATQLTADGEAHELKELGALGPYVRAVTALGGGSNPSHTVVVKLASTGPFHIKAK